MTGLDRADTGRHRSPRDLPLSDIEAGHVDAARATNTLRAASHPRTQDELLMILSGPASNMGGADKDRFLRSRRSVSAKPHGYTRGGRNARPSAANLTMYVAVERGARDPKCLADVRYAVLPISG
jgi:hypothetical protein